jgi:hypothetical protein
LVYYIINIRYGYSVSPENTLYFTQALQKLELPSQLLLEMAVVTSGYILAATT